MAHQNWTGLNRGHHIPLLSCLFTLTYISPFCKVTRLPMYCFQNRCFEPVAMDAELRDYGDRLRTLAAKFSSINNNQFSDGAQKYVDKIGKLVMDLEVLPVPGTDSLSGRFRCLIHSFQNHVCPATCCYSTSNIVLFIDRSIFTIKQY